MHNCEGQGGLACSTQWNSKESDTTELLNNINMHNCESVLKRITREER